MKKKVTMQDIAQDTGLSISTVSRALARNGKISKEKEILIFESAHRLHYPMAMQHTPIELRKCIHVALVTKHYTGEFFASLFEGFDQATRGIKARIHLISVSHANSTPSQVIADLKKSHFDAAIVFLPDYTEADYAALLKQVPPEFPIISIAPIANPVIDTVTFDNYRGGYLVANHFEKRGFKSFGIIHGPVSKSEAMVRKNGFIDYIRALKSLQLVWEFEGDYSIQDGKNAYTHFKNSKTKPEAIFCSNDSMTIGFIHSAIRDGVHIPGEVAVAGFDDLPTCELYTPTITSVHTPYNILGIKALELIFDRLKSNQQSHHTGYTSLIPVTLSVRESSTQLKYALQHK